MNYQQSAKMILKYLGGNQNIINFEHCSTRLRFSVVEKQKINIDELKKIPGVIGIIINAQIQIIIGNNVIEMYDEIIKLYAPQNQNNQVEKKAISTILLEFIVGIFQPLVPAIAGAGVLKSILILLSTLGIVSTNNNLYIILSSISDATFYFLPIMVAITTATKLNTNKLVAVGAIGVLLHPGNINLLSKGISLFGFSIKNISYNAQVFPAILITLFLGILEKYLNKVSPKSIRVFFVPMLSLAITIPLALLILGPLGYTLGEYLSTFIIFLYENLGFIAVALVAGILPFMIATGMHKAMIPYAISSMGKFGFEALYLPASLGHNISEAGACFAVALKSKDKQLKSTALSAGISALMGITEPALYGITLLHKKVLYSVVLSGFISGLVVGFFGLKSFVLAGPGLANITMFLDPQNSKNILYGLSGFLLALVLSFVFTLVIWKEEKKQNFNKEEGSVDSKETLSHEMYA